jgi:hypothetical protein
MRQARPAMSPDPLLFLEEPRGADWTFQEQLSPTIMVAETADPALSEAPLASVPVAFEKDELNVSMCCTSRPSFSRIVTGRPGPTGGT